MNWKWKRIAVGAVAALLTAGLALSYTGCTKQDAPAEDDREEVSQAQAGDADEAPAADLPIPGLSAENYPRVDGSTANMPLMARIYSEVCGVSAEEGETMVSASGGTGAVWWNMIYEGADLLLVYEAPENLKEEIAGMGLELEINPIGRDGLVFLVNSQNPVDDLSVEQLQRIYTGEITDWSQVGGENGAIAPFQRNEESGSQTLFLKLLMPGLTPMNPPTELVPAGMGALIDGVAAYDGSGGALGYSVYYYAEQMYANPDLKLLSVDGIAPSTQSIADNSYPLTNEFYVVIRADEPQGSPARLLRDWILTEGGSKAMADTGYVALY